MLPSRALRCAPILIACLPLLLLGCGKLEGGPQNAGSGAPPGVATGNIVLQLAVSNTNLDRDNEDVGAVNVTVSEVTIFPDEGSTSMQGVGSIGPMTLLAGAAGFNLLALQGNPVTLASGPVPVADYQRLRVVVSGASVTLENGETNNLEVDNGTVERGIDVRVEEGQTETVTVTINVRESLRLNKNNRGAFRPQINVSD